MGAHILLVSERNYEICITREVYGCVQPTTEWNRAEIIAGLYSLQLDDLIFFYVKNKGIYGLWKVVSEPFYDDEAIWTDTNQLYPYRFLIGRSFGTFQNPISLSDILDLHDKGKIWTFDLNPVQQKNQYKITMDEAKELLRLLLRNNQLWQPKYDSFNTYNPQKRETIKIDFGERKNGSISTRAG